MPTMWASNGECVQLATRIPRALHRAIRLDAIGRDVTVSQWVSDALAAHLERAKGAKPAKAPLAAAK